MAPGVGAASFHISQTPQPVGKLDQAIRDTKQTIEEVKLNRERAAALPPDERTAFFKKMDRCLERLEGYLKKLTDLRGSFHVTGYQIDSLTAQFKEHHTAYLADVETFKTDRDHVKKSNQVFSATLQQTTFSFPTSSTSKAYPAARPVVFMTSPAERKFVLAEQRWRYRAEKQSPGDQEGCHKKVDKMMYRLLKEYEAQVSSSSEIETPGQPDPLSRSIEIIDKEFDREYPIPAEKN